jgi:hypothetical protein
MNRKRGAEQTRNTTIGVQTQQQATNEMIPTYPIAFMISQAWRFTWPLGARAESRWESIVIIAANGHWFVAVDHIPGGLDAYFKFHTRGCALEQSSGLRSGGDQPFRDT